MRTKHPAIRGSAKNAPIRGMANSLIQHAAIAFMCEKSKPNETDEHVSL